MNTTTATVAAGAHMILATETALHGLQFSRDAFDNLCLKFDRREVPILGQLTKIESADGLKLKIIIHRVRIKKNLHIRFSLHANQPATLTTQRPKK